MYEIKNIEINLEVTSVEDTIRWYERTLNWKGHQDVFDEEGNCTFGSVGSGDRVLNLVRSSQELREPNFSIFISVDDVDEAFRVLKENGYDLGAGPTDTFWGGRVFSIKDINGYRLQFVEMVEDLTLEEIRGRLG